MKARYRILHFVANPVAGTRVPVAVLVRGEQGLRVVRNPHPPGARCLGTKRGANLLRLMMPTIEGIEEFERLPDELGPAFQLSESRAVPASVGDRWIQRLIFPEVVETAEPRRIRRSVQGRQWLERRGVGAIVRSRFDVGDLGLRQGNVEAVTHYVDGPQRLMLMEPLAPLRTQTELRADLKKVATRLRANRDVLRGLEREQDYLAYLLPGNFAKGFVEHVRNDFAEFGRVVDCNVEADASRFVRSIGHAADSLPIH